jgi:hypothetical protein
MVWTLIVDAATRNKKVILRFMHTFLKGDSDEEGLRYFNILYSGVPVYGRKCAGTGNDWL